MKTTYEWKRNKLIGKAEAYANRACSDARQCRKGEPRSARWNRLFHAKMNALAKEAGI